MSELNARIKRRLSSDARLNNLWVRGELSNVVNHRSGHRYFTLKDGDHQISCVLFRNQGRRLDFELKNGLNVLIFGDVDFYMLRGQVQILVKVVEKDSGLGNRYQELEALKRKLALAGLFDLERKRPLPNYPKTIGIVTSPDGAALRDVLRILGEYPARIIISPAQVQGEDAPLSIASAIKNLQEKVEVIIVCRGGGSAEDLWSFNSEIVARAIFQSLCPVVSAVGHETDVTIADFVADARAPTPSAAAELIMPDVIQLKKSLRDMEMRMIRSLVSSLERRRSKFTYLGRGLSSRVMRDKVGKKRYRLEQLSKRLLSLEIRRVDVLNKRLNLAQGQLSSLSPLATLSRGYSIARADGNVIRRADDVDRGAFIELILSEGLLKCKVIDKDITFDELW